MYQGKYQGAAPRPRRKRRSPMGTILFYAIYFGLILAFFVGMRFAMTALEDWLVNFEAAQPKVKSQEVFDRLFADPDWAELYALAGCQDTAYEDKDDYAAYMAEKTAGQELTFLETSAGIDRTKKKYNVKSGSEKIASFMLVDTATGETPEWELGAVELFFTREQSCTIRVSPGCTVSVNGVPLDESHIIRTVITMAENYLPEGVHGYRLTELRVEGLLKAPEITATDSTGAELGLVYDEKTATYSCDQRAAVLGDNEYQTLLNAAQTYCKYMIGAADRTALKNCFDADSQIYSTIVGNDTWMQSYKGYDFGTETITDFYRYSESLYSARVALTLNVTRKDGSIKEYKLDTTFFLTESQGWKVTEMTNVDVQKQTTQVRLTYINGTETLESIMIDAHAGSLKPPAVTAPEGQVFTGWYYESVGENGKKTMTLAFLPDENGTVSLGDATLEPMTLYALYESEGQ